MQNLGNVDIDHLKSHAGQPQYFRGEPLRRAAASSPYAAARPILRFCRGKSRVRQGGRGGDSQTACIFQCSAGVCESIPDTGGSLSPSLSPWPFCGRWAWSARQSPFASGHIVVCPAPPASPYLSCTALLCEPCACCTCDSECAPLLENKPWPATLQAPVCSPIMMRCYARTSKHHNSPQCQRRVVPQSRHSPPAQNMRGVGERWDGHTSKLMYLFCLSKEGQRPSATTRHSDYQISSLHTIFRLFLGPGIPHKSSLCAECLPACKTSCGYSSRANINLDFDDQNHHSVFQQSRDTLMSPGASKKSPEPNRGNGLPNASTA